MNSFLRFGLAIALMIIGATACIKKEISMVSVPTITGVNKYLLHVGDTLVISGSGFSSNAADNQVAIATSSLTVTQASGSQLSAVIQTGTQSGQLTISLPAGKSAVYDSAIQIIGATQPYVTSISPSVAYTGDTIIIRGGNFGVPGNTNTVVISGISCLLYNATDSVLRVVLPSTVHTGALTVTTNGVTSPAFSFTVQKFSPLQDGRLYWLYGTVGYQNNTTQLYRGVDSAIGFPYGTVVFNNPTNDEAYWPYMQAQQGFGLEPMPGDAQGNAYYVTPIMGQFGSPTTEYQVVKLALNGGAVTHTVLQDIDWGTATTNAPGMNAPVPVQPDFLSVDGNTLYEHIGVTNTWYTADLTAVTPTLTQTSGVLNDSTGFGVQFTPNYIFYDLGGTIYNASLDHITQVRYLQRGSTTTKAVPLPSDETIIMTLSAPGHGDNVLIFTETTVGVPSVKIYKFNPSVQTLQLLYGPDNWKDAAQSLYAWNTEGFLWAGSHIYYADSRYSPINPNTLGPTYTSLFVLNDDGSTTNPRNVYPRLEPADAQGIGGYFPLFAGKL